MKLLVFCALAVVAVQALPKPRSDDYDYLRVCYVSNWSQYRPGIGKYEMPDVDPYLCTHLMYSFVEIGTNNELKLREWNGDKLISQLLSWKQTNPDLKVLAAVGGWNFGTDRFTAVCADEGTMRHFATTTVDFLHEWGFDGLDLDWEYPGSRGSPPEDKERFTRLIEIILEEFAADQQATSQPRLLLSSAVAAGEGTIELAYEISEICQLLDFVNLMTYDFHGGSWEAVTGHNAPLKGHTGYPGLEMFNVESAVDIWLGGGCDPRKLIMGVPTYGRTFTLEDASNNGYNASATGPGTAGTYTREAGFLAYYEICPLVSQGTIVWNEEVQAPALAYGDQWIAYDDKDSIGVKVDYMKSRGLGGIMVWATDNDDFTAVCGEKYPLLRKIYYELVGDRSPACFISPTTTAVTWWPPATTTESPPYGTVCWYPANEGGSTPVVTTTTTNPDVTTTTTTTEPTTTTQATCSDEDGFYADETRENCYYTCFSGIRTNACCATGNLWDDAEKTCYTPAFDEKTFCVDKDDGIYAHPDGNTKFVQCSGGRAFVTDCAAGTVFDGSNCVFP